MSGTLRLKGSTSGYSELQAPAVAGDQTFILPAAGGTLLTTDSPAPTLTLESGIVTSPSLTFEGDSNTGIYSPAANNVAITTGGGQRLFVGSAGNIGIGTDSPTQKLDLEDDAGARIAFTDTGTKRYSIGNPGAGGSSLTIRDESSAADRLVINNVGNIGIGTDSPDGLLHLASSGEARLIIDGDINNEPNENAALIELKTDAGAVRHSILAPEGTNNDFEIVAGSSGTSSSVSCSLSFFTKPTATTDSAERMRITSGGNVGIGTTSPQSELTVRGSTPQITLEPTADTQTCRIQFTTTDGTIQSTIQGGGSEGSAIKFVDSIAATERMRIDSSGNVLIRRTANTDGGVLTVDQDASSNNVGISTITTSTSSRFHLLFRNGNGQVGSIATSGSATSYNTSSDYRLKENVVNIADGITRVKQLQPKRFNFITDADTTVDGFLAHEAQAVVPEAVTGTKDAVDEEGNPDYQGIDQSKLVPLLTAALQEAISKIETLETKVAALEAGS